MAISEKLRDEIAAENAKHQRLRNGLLPALHRLLRACGEITPGDAEELAGIFEMRPVEVLEVVRVYDLVKTARRGRYQVRVCIGPSCSRDGARDFLDDLADRLQISVGEITAEGRIELGQEACLGACAVAPMMWIGGDFYEDLDLDRALQILAELE